VASEQVERFQNLLRLRLSGLVWQRCALIDAWENLSPCHLKPAEAEIPVLQRSFIRALGGTKAPWLARSPRKNSSMYGMTSNRKMTVMMENT
jgi:hypothetical protein